MDAVKNFNAGKILCTPAVPTVNSELLK